MTRLDNQLVKLSECQLKLDRTSPRVDLVVAVDMPQITVPFWSSSDWKLGKLFFAKAATAQNDFLSTQYLRVSFCLPHVHRTKTLLSTNRLPRRTRILGSTSRTIESMLSML